MKMIGNNDRWIAAAALAADLTLVSRLAGIRRVRGLKSQQIWVRQPARVLP